MPSNDPFFDAFLSLRTAESQNEASLNLVTKILAGVHFSKPGLLIEQERELKDLKDRLSKQRTEILESLAKVLAQDPTLVYDKNILAEAQKHFETLATSKYK